MQYENKSNIFLDFLLVLFFVLVLISASQLRDNTNPTGILTLQCCQSKISFCYQFLHTFSYVFTIDMC